MKKKVKKIPDIALHSPVYFFYSRKRLNVPILYHEVQLVIK